jgi:hypothetical protein
MLLTRSAGASLSQQVYSILQKYGTDAHVYLPGIGVINGLTAGNYLDSAGTTAATVDNPVGLVLDAANSVLGSEKVVNGTFDANTTGWGGSNANATLTWQSGGTALFQNVADFAYVKANPAITLTAGWYKVSFDVLTYSHTTASGVHIGLGTTGNNVLSIGSKSYITYIAGGTTEFQIRPNAVGVGTITIDNISVKEVTGIHAIQSTTANKPVLRITNGRYWWDMVDGTDLLSATYPAGWESVTTIDAAPTGQATLTAQNIVGTYAITTDTYGRFVFKTITASELATMQTFANRLAGL